MRTCVLIAIVFATLGVSSAQAGMRSVKRSPSVESYRPTGETRIWTFVSRDSTVGHLISTIEESRTINGQKAVVISEKLKYDYRKIGSELSIDANGKHFVSQEGYYLGEQVMLSMAGKKEELELERDGDKLVGFFTRGDEKIDQTLACGSTRFAWDNSYVDQLELYFTMHDLSVGMVLQDSVFAALPMVTSAFRAEVVNFDHVRLYNEKFDSAFVIQITQPQNMRVFFTPDKRLVKIDMVDASTKIYLDAVTRPPFGSATGRSKASVLSYLPSIITSAMLAFIAILFYGWRGFKSSLSAWAALFGAIAFWATPFTLIPLQMWLVKSWLVPQFNAGGSLYLLSLVPSLAAGLIQELLKFSAVGFVARLRPVKSFQWVSFGAFTGASFGFFEACYLAGTSPVQPLVSLDLLGRASFMLFHASSGLLLGLSLKRGRNPMIVILAGTIVTNALFRYLPVFVQQKAAPVTAVYLVICLLATLSVLATLVVGKRHAARFSS